MSSKKNIKIDTKEEIKSEDDIYNIKIFRRTLENYTHEVIEDNKIKKITSWRKSKSKFLQSLILNIFTLGILHILSLIYPNLYIKLYCNRRKPKECDFFLVEDIYGNLTLCKKIYKKDKTQKNSFTSASTKEEIINSSFSNIKKSLTKNLTYSFKYKSITYEYDEKTNEIKPVYMDLLDLTNKDIFHYFSEGLSSEDTVKLFQNRYGKNEYVLNLKISSLYLIRIELPHLIFIIIIGIIELVLGDLISFITKITFIAIIMIAGYITFKKNILEPYKNEYTLDGEKHKIRVKRDYKLKEKSEIFSKIDNCDLLPGDIIYLKSNDFVPCDCLILDGECMADSNNLIGNLNIARKFSLENKNIPFNYKLNKDNILYHGMKIIKSYSNLKQEYISALCINTGSNTYKANLYSNTFYLFERNKEYQEKYKFFNKERKSFFITFIIIFMISIIIGIIYMILILNKPKELLHLKDKNLGHLYIIIPARILCKSSMTIFFLIKSIVLLLGVWDLKKENVYTLEKAKLLSSNNIDTIFINKTGTLCEEKFEINGYHPISVNQHNLNNLGFRTYNTNQNKELNLQLVKYYKDYLNRINELSNLTYKKDPKSDNNKVNAEMATQKCCKYSTIFLESLLSCNDLKKYGMEIFGNPIDSEIFKTMKWDIKSDINLNNNSDIDFHYHKTDISSNLSKISYEKEINDIFPSNYYKITESMKNENQKDNQKENQNQNLARNSIYNINFSITEVTENFEEKRNSLISNNYVENNILKSNINSYKLRIYKRFIKDNSLSLSSISYNFITKELRFNTKGIPEDILDKCNQSTIPDNFDKILSFYRRRGLIVIICASKKINIKQYSESDSEDKYLNNLNFCGFITLKNRLKDEVIYAINNLRDYNCNFIISTGDGIYNSLPVGFESTILEKKDIYSFEKDEIKNRIIIQKIYNSKDSSDNKDKGNDNEIINEFNNVERNSRISSNYSRASEMKISSPKGKLKQSKIFENSENNFSSYLKSDKKLEQFNLDVNNSEITKDTQKIPNNKRSRNLKSGYFNNMYSTSSRNILFSNDSSKSNSISTINRELKNKSKKSKKTLNSFDFNFLDTPLKGLINKKNMSSDKNEILYYYQDIFEDHKELSEDCIYCIDSKVFDFLYKNKNKRHAKILLEKIHEKCRIFYNMTSLTKSKVIDYYREFKDKCICSIGACQSDIDQIFSSNIGIYLQLSNNLNTVLSHFYSPDANLLIIKKIIRAGRAVTENLLLVKLACILYTLIANSYIMACFFWEIDIFQGQSNVIEISFIILSIAAFTSKIDIREEQYILIQKKNLYFCHYLCQVIGMIIFKLIGIYFHASTFNSNDFIEENERGKIYCSFYFLFCLEQLFSTVYILNLIGFYRKSSYLNTIFIILFLIILAYFVCITSLTNSNYNVDVFSYLYFEHLENIVDAYDENNKINVYLICFIDFVASLIYSRVVYHVFIRIAKNTSNNNEKK